MRDEEIEIKKTDEFIIRITASDKLVLFVEDVAIF